MDAGDARGDDVTELRALGLRHVFGGVHALDGVDVEVHSGEVVGIIGPNGCGKTTLVDAVSGVLRAQDGCVEVHGRNLTGASPAAFARAGLARTFQATRLLESLDTESNVRLGLHASGSWRRQPQRRRARAALDTVGIAALADRPVRELSHGQRRRVELARALVGEPALLILDEPTAGLFPAQARDVLQVLRDTAARGTAILMVEHDLGVVAALCHRVIVMGEGRVLDEGPTGTVLTAAAAEHLAAEVSTDRLVEVPA
ncbi:MAG: ABC transporter ATP-binding protein [Candidatus Aeolococcus gillhamiae]|uniref:ABC transporter ATP-binding protein n=1 Tax=Candidatus Aeolococcus gillhamiae TaxID=3127015 RepID=A0A2W5ZAP4_9BACT|nr:MAG: ABC transporter ATP-binding protein [Candidatus Dormibacter sp. RRmetagenome_bin12]